MSENGKKHVRPIAWKAIEEALLRGENISIMVVPTSAQGIPPTVLTEYEQGDAMRIDLFGNRPLNPVFDDSGFSVDLCFGRTSVRCKFSWDAVLGYSDGSNVSRFNMACALIPCIVMEDNTLVPAIPDLAKPDKGPRLQVVK